MAADLPPPRGPRRRADQHDGSDTVVVAFCATDAQLAAATALGHDAGVRTVHVGGWADHGSGLRLESRGEDGIGIEGVRRSLGFDWPTLQVVTQD